MRLETAKVQDFDFCSSWEVSRSSIFDESLSRMLNTFPDLKIKLLKFVASKIADPINLRYGKHDRRMVGYLSGFWHCHLRDDAVLIYRVGDRTLTLIYLAPHAEIEGRRLHRTAKRLSQFI